MSKKELIFFSIVSGLGVIAIVNYFLWWFSFAHVATANTTFLSVNLILFILLSFVVWHGLLQRLAIWFVVFFMRKPVYVAPEGGLKVAMLTCFVPGKEPYDLLERTLKAMTEVEYPHDTWVLDEGNDPAVKEICFRLGVFHFSRKGIARYNQESGPFKAKTKSGNHNAWRDANERYYDFVAQMDMDHVPFKNYLDRILGYFRDPKVGFVVAPQIYTNTDNWIARGAAEQSYIFHGPLQQGFYGQDMPLFIGTNHAYRPKALQEAGGYASTIVEDHLTGMYFQATGWKGVYCPEVIAEGDGPTNWIEYFNQQMRWSYGIFEVLFTKTPKILPKLNWNKRISYLAAQTYYLTGVASIVSIFLTALYLVFGYTSASLDLESWILHASPPFAIAIFLQFWVQRFYLNPKEESGIGWRGMLLSFGAMPIYAIAFWKIVTRQKLQYAVTAKGTSAGEYNVPIRVFAPHIFLIGITLLAMVVSIYTGNDAIQLRFWAMVSVVLFSIVILSAQEDSLRYSLNLIPKPSHALRLGSVMALILVISITSPAFSQVRAPGQIGNIIETAQASPAKLGTEESQIYLGISGSELWNQQDEIEASTARKFLLVGRYTSWGDPNNRFEREWAQQLREKSSIPLITWEPWSNNFEGRKPYDQPKFTLNRIANGEYDEYISQYALDVKAWGGPVMIRFAHEMNGNWYPWGGSVNGNRPEDYKSAWIQVHNIFSDLKVKNVTWVWSPNEPFYDQEVPFSANFDVFYPGDEYVDWVAFSAFNWGKISAYTSWRTFEEVVEPSYKLLEKYDKPIMISEINTSSVGGSKEKWMQDANEKIRNYPKIKAVVWFESSHKAIFKIDRNPAHYSAF